MARNADTVLAMIILIVAPSCAIIANDTGIAQDYAFFLTDSTEPEPHHDERLLLGMYPATLRSTSTGP